MSALLGTATARSDGRQGERSGERDTIVPAESFKHSLKDGKTGPPRIIMEFPGVPWASASQVKRRASFHGTEWVILYHEGHMLRVCLHLYPCLTLIMVVYGARSTCAEASCSASMLRFVGSSRPVSQGTRYAVVSMSYFSIPIDSAVVHAVFRPPLSEGRQAPSKLPGITRPDMCGRIPTRAMGPIVERVHGPCCGYHLKGGR